MKRLVPLVLVLALANCATVQRVQASDQGISLNETLHLHGIAVMPVEIIEDSRCPIDATCFWAGRVVLRATVASDLDNDNASRSVDFISGEPQTLFGETIELETIMPDRSTDAAPDTRDYRFTFALAENQ